MLKTSDVEMSFLYSGPVNWDQLTSDFDMLYAAGLISDLVEEERQEDLDLVIECLTADRLEDALGVIFHNSGPVDLEAVLHNVSVLLRARLVLARKASERKALSEKWFATIKVYVFSTRRWIDRGYRHASASEDGTHNLVLKTRHLKERVVKLGSEIKANNPQLSRQAIARIIKDKHGVKRSLSTLRRYLTPTRPSDPTLWEDVPWWKKS